VCLILFAVNPNERFRLIVAANRDELYARPTVNADFWPEHPDILAGRDENMGGTWLGIDRQGRFAAVTNFREEPPAPLPPRSRGDLPLNFLNADTTPLDYVKDVSTRSETYRGFNLIVADSQSTLYYGNRAGNPRELADGYYGLSNQVLDCDWPKVIEGRQRLQKKMESDADDLSESLFELLLSSGDDREFSNSFISGDEYGTRAASVVLKTHDGEIYFEERNFGPGGKFLNSNGYNFNCGYDS
jgi:uncharacterized protein with NRDE domain